MRYFFAMILLVAVAAAKAAPLPTSRPTQFVEANKCVTSACHPGVKKYPRVHGPVAVDACDACHEWVDYAAHSFAPTRKGAEQCTYCHEFDVSKMPVIHKPVAEGECAGCHDPHGGETRAMVREKSTAELCGRCHESVTHSRSVLHTPVAKGECDACHPPHAARFPKLVDAAGSDLCLSCHDGFAVRLAGALFKHKALDDGCTKCHDAHGSNHNAAATQPVVEQCTNCHEPIKAQIAKAAVKHAVVSEDRACVTCHTPHGGNLASLMSDLPSAICLNCHGQRVPGFTMAAAPELLNGSMRQHAPARDGACGMPCHTVHGGSRKRLLAMNYASNHFQRFDPASYALCFACHTLELATVEQTSTFTAFRNGRRNLHYVHVNDKERGENCSVCHGVHAAENARIVRNVSKFGTWQMPVNFRKTDSGGGCQPGCHVPMDYDRETPVPPTTQATTRPAIPLPPSRSEQEKATFVHWTGKDGNGNTVAIPDAKRRPSVLVFARVEQVGAIAKLLAAAIPNASKVQTIVLTDQGASADSVSLADQLQILGYPTTLLIRGDGLVIARIGGSTEALPMRLRNYLDDGAKALKPNIWATTAPASAPASTASTTESRALRLLRSAEKLLEAGKLEEAEKTLTEARRLQPYSAPVQIARVKVMIAMGRGEQALARLSDIPLEAIASSQRQMLEAEALIAMQEWSRAKTILEQLIAREPTSIEARRALASIYERDGNWQAAANEYRAIVNLKK